MSMTIQEAIKRINEHMSIHHIGEYPHIYLAEAMQMALNALREKAEREDPQPLTYEEMLQMHDEVVWFEVLDIKDPETPCESVWTQVWVWNTSISYFMFGNECDLMPKMENYGKTWICYRHKPKEVKEA